MTRRQFLTYIAYVIASVATLAAYGLSVLITFGHFAERVVLAPAILGDQTGALLGGLFGVLSADIGALVWCLTFVLLARNTPQRVISALMATTCLLIAAWTTQDALAVAFGTRDASAAASAMMLSSVVTWMIVTQVGIGFVYVLASPGVLDDVFIDAPRYIVEQPRKAAEVQPKTFPNGTDKRRVARVTANGRAVVHPRRGGE